MSASPDKVADAREQREREFHDRVYGSGEYHDRPAAKFYSIARSAYDYYQSRLLTDVEGADVLEYGCGDGSYAFDLARRGAKVTGIDISAIAIEQAAERARDEGVDQNSDFQVMNCEQLAFADRSFDLVCGGGILHHIDLAKGYAEIARVLRPDGVSVFLEPMGHNPLINRYRDRTPEQRTPDEHPLLEADLEQAGEYFADVETRFFNLLSLAAVPLRGRAGFDRVNGALDRTDRWLFEHFPATRKHAWMVAIVMRQPR